MTPTASRLPPALAALRSHASVYATEAALLGLFMVSACGFAVLLEHPGSPVRQAIASDGLRRLLMGLAMGATAIVLIYNRWGQRSGPHLNPALTLCFLWLRRIKPWDALFYIVAQCVGGLSGVLLAAAIIPGVHAPAINYVATKPGGSGPIVAWVAEFIIALVLMATILTVNARPRLAPFGGCCAGLLLVLFITFEAPYSGMSLNPARTLASAWPAGVWTAWWVYLTAPLAGMAAAIEALALLGRGRRGLCGKLCHSRKVPCIFECDCLRVRVVEPAVGKDPSCAPLSTTT